MSLCGKKMEREKREKTGMVKDNEWILLMINTLLKAKQSSQFISFGLDRHGMQSCPPSTIKQTSKLALFFFFHFFFCTFFLFFNERILLFKNFSDKTEAFFFSLCNFSTGIFPVRHDILVEGKKSECVWFTKNYWHGGNKDKIVPLVAMSKDFQSLLGIN